MIGVKIFGANEPEQQKDFLSALRQIAADTRTKLDEVTFIFIPSNIVQPKGRVKSYINIEYPQEDAPYMDGLIKTLKNIFLEKGEDLAIQVIKLKQTEASILIQVKDFIPKCQAV